MASMIAQLEPLLTSYGLTVDDLPKIAASLTLALVILIWRSIKPYNVPKGVPQLPSKPFVGCLPLIAANWLKLPDFMLKFDSKYKRSWAAPVPSIGLLGNCMFSLCTEENVKHVLKDSFNTYEKGKNVRDALGEFLGTGIFASDGALWKYHRKVASNMFSRNLMRTGTTVALQQVQRVRELLEKTPSTKTLDMQDVFFRMTIDVFASIAFGVELNSVLSDKQHPFAEAFDEVQNLSQKRFQDPFWRLKRSFGLTDAERRISKNCKVMNEFASSVIKAKRRDADNNAKMGPDLLSRFLDSKNPIDPEGKPPSNTELRDIVMNFMIAGRDTTACALSWSMYEISKHPEVSAKIIEEVTRVCKGDDDVSTYSYENIGNLTYTHAVAMEVLRLHPSVPVDIKFAVKDDTLPDGTFIPQNATVIYSPYAMGRSKEIWGADALEFKPERFLSDEGSNVEPSQYKYTTFNAGYRLCLGKPLAMLEIKLTLAMLLPNFKFTITNGHKGGYVSTLVLPMSPGLEMKVERR
mmetsp:Transcript_14659/g.29168  ORF Transcript_14659/g.29168 Transcript_14659/m.29168 type:complete len:521 (-) Transcript_14659:82-1644(-)